MYYNNNISYIDNNNNTIISNNSVVIDKGEQEYNDTVNDINNRFHVNINDMDSLKSMDDDTLIEFVKYCTNLTCNLCERSVVFNNFTSSMEENLSPELYKKIDDILTEGCEKAIRRNEEARRRNEETRRTILKGIEQLKKDIDQTLHEYTDAYEYALKHL